MQNEARHEIKNPDWWTDEHTSGWERVKQAFQRDWEQTKADFSKHGGQQLNQQVGDTVKQAVGSEAIPRPGQPNHSGDFAAVEPAYRYGYGAHLKYGSEPSSTTWSDALDDRLSKEWSKLGTQESWTDVRPRVRRVWDMRLKP